MPNLSQLKRERMLAFLQKIKDEHRDDNDMLIALGEIESELTSKKYGLVWEEHEEEVDEKMKTHIPVFTEDVSKEIVAPLGELNEQNTYILVTVTVPKNIQDFSVNLKAPIVINMDNHKGVQLIVEDDYPVKYKVYDVLKAKKEKAGE